MSNKMICPVCQQELVREGMNHWWCLCNLNHQGKELYGTTALWQALIQAKQDLEIALAAIKEVAEECGCLMAALKSTGFESVVETFDEKIRKRIKQIEHKE